MSWPEYLPSFDQLNYEANDIHTNNASQDDDNENTYFISDTSESETSMNHEPALYFEGHPYPRHLSVDETQLVEDLIRKNVKPKDILSTLKKENVENLSILPTIYNSHQKFRMKENSGKTQMQVVMSFLAENGYIYYSHADKSTNELQDLLFAHQRSLEM
ncbi:uncharacterized protein LOC128134161 [Lactuca sativa]|uniref:uncharacterized protein LOC128134161 n=1 Tax=Lactuca sativa TaxID=4236 RepID=UPI0022AF89D8|nr:uncharacterized protein LOC128134161 [Lactuca sativa]